MRKTFSTNTLDSNGHAAIFYDNPQELWRVLAEYFHTGFEENELGILVTHYTPDQVIEGFKSAGLNVINQISKGDLRLFNMKETYLPDGRFVSEFMSENVLSFIEDARKQGYSGLRTAGEMSWLKEHPEFSDEAHIYEHDVNKLTADNQTFTGLCLYAVDDDSPAPMIDVEKVLETHPTYFYRGELLKSSAYMD